ncbi:MAG: hypothetical protein U0V74_08480 [Chitinophagales bacterium]
MRNAILFILVVTLLGSVVSFYAQRELGLGRISPELEYYHLFIPYNNGEHTKENLSPQQKRAADYIDSSFNSMQNEKLADDIRPEMAMITLVFFFVSLIPAYRVYRGKSLSSTIAITIVILYVAGSLWLRFREYWLYG